MLAPRSIATPPATTASCPARRHGLAADRPAGAVQQRGVMGADSGFNWDNTNKRLGIGTASPSQKLDVCGL